MFAVLTWQSFAGELFEGEALPLSIVTPTVSDARAGQAIRKQNNSGNGAPLLHKQ